MKKLKNEWIEQAQKTLWSRDLLGYNFEMPNIEVLKKSGLYKHVVYRNPENPRLWKRKKGMGVDMVIKVGYYTFYIEESFCSRDYYYRRKWFEECRLPRFEHYPNDKLHRHIILTNNPRNFHSVEDLAKEHGIQIMDINDLLTLIRSSTKPPDFAIRKLVSSVLVSSKLDSNLVYNLVSSMNTSYNKQTKQTNNKLNNVYAYDNHTNKANRFKRKYKNKLQKIIPKRPKRGKKRGD